MVNSQTRRTQAFENIQADINKTFNIYRSTIKKPATNRAGFFIGYIFERVNNLRLRPLIS
jgi:hypothetical protein